MKPLSIATIAALALLMCPAELVAGEDTWSLVTVAGDTLYNCLLDTIADNSIEATHSGRQVLVPLDSIAILFRHREAKVGKRVIGGALVGIAVGAMLGLATHKKPEHALIDYGPQGAALGGALLGGLVGAVAGATVARGSGGTEEVVIAGMPVKHKVQAIKWLQLDRIGLAQELAERQSNP
jgi:hypothetical protein